MKLFGRLAGVFALVAVSAMTVHAQTPWITGYFSAQNGVLSASNIPWNKYTHISHFAASTDGKGNVLNYYLTTNDAADPTSINNFVAAGHTAGRKVLVTIKDNDNDYSLFPSSASSTYINTFVTNIVTYITSNGYDGVDIDWEKNINTTQFEQLIQNLRTAFNHSTNPGATLTIGANGNVTTVAAWANPANGSQHLLDQINVMCYDEDWGDRFSWYVGPLNRAGNNRVQACDAEMKQFMNAGVAKSSLGLGMPFYGRRWPGVTQALQQSNFNKTITFSYRCLANDPARWQQPYMKYDTKYNANYLSIPSPAEFDSYTDTQFLNTAVNWGKNTEGVGGYMVFTIEYEYLGAPYGTAGWPNNACSNVTTGPTGDAAFPLSTGLYNAVLSTYNLTVVANESAPHRLVDFAFLNRREAQ